MPRHEVRTEIEAPADVVWDVLTDLACYADWNPFVTQAEGRFAVGEVIAIEVDLGGPFSSFKQRITEIVPGARWAWTSASAYTALATRGTRTFTVEPRGADACTLVDVEEVGGVLAAWVERTFGEAMSQGMTASGRALARRAEAVAAGETPAGPWPRPPVVGGERGLSTAAAARLLTRIMFDPIQMIEDHRAEHGELFTLPIPWGITPPFTFLTTREGYTSVLRLDPEIGRNGPIIDRVPALAHWTPRSDPSDDHLQALLLAGRQLIGTLVRGRPAEDIDATLRRAVDERIATWPDEVDLAGELVSLIHDASARLLVGDDLWEALGADTPSDLRTIVNAVDAARAATALSPAARLLPEHGATRRLGARILELVSDPTSRRFPYVAAAREVLLDGKPAAPEDVAWMVFFGLWNATLYTGTYGTWAFLDLLDHPTDLAAVRDPGAERTDLLTGGIVETMRRNPISWQLRSLAAPVQVTSEGRTYTVPKGHYLSVFSHGLNRDPAVYPDPLAWRPRRYMEGAPAPLLFGAGPFSCVAQRWVKMLLATIHAALLDRLDVTLVDPLPQRISRVHLLYPDRPVRARIRRRRRVAV